MTDTSQTTLLRIAAFLVDAVSMSILLILPASVISYLLALFGTPKAVQFVWFGALGILSVAILLRDGYRGRSMGKRLLGLRLVTPKGEGCTYPRSMARNFPLLIPGWNLIEVVMVVAGRRRTGDRIARTIVSEE